MHILAWNNKIGLWNYIVGLCYEVMNKRVKADLILIFSTNTNRESVAYRSFQFLEFEVRGVRKVTTGKNLTL